MFANSAVISRVEIAVADVKAGRGQTQTAKGGGAARTGANRLRRGDRGDDAMMYMCLEIVFVPTQWLQLVGIDRSMGGGTRNSKNKKVRRVTDDTMLRCS